MKKYIAPIPKLLLPCLCLAWLAAPLAANCAEKPKTMVSGPNETTELWQGKVLTAKFRVGMCYSPDGKARGVLLLKHRNGQEDVYHLYGTLRNNAFELTHSSGHYFSGKLTGPGTMEGKAKLSGGMSLSLKGTRTRNAPVIAEDCAPLP